LASGRGPLGYETRGESRVSFSLAFSCSSPSPFCEPLGYLREESLALVRFDRDGVPRQESRNGETFKGDGCEFKTDSVNRVSKKHVAGTTGSGGTSDVDGEESTIVDIGITVDVSEISDPVDGGTELAFDEAELAEAAEGADETDDTSDVERDAGIDADERAVLEAADIDPNTIADKEYSYRMLLDAGVDETIAATLRRRFSLPWSFESEGDLDRRSSEVRGLGDAEREWIAVSDDEDWQAFEYEHSEPIAIERERPSERPYPRPTPITAVTGVGPDDADVLAEAGIRSAERLATVDAMGVANALDLNVLHVRTWRHNARELVD
jgi:predicted flap endonuclease-1-like 5' DNA nuclease